MIRFLCWVQDDIVANVEAKLAAWTFLPEGICLRHMYTFLTLSLVAERHSSLLLFFYLCCLSENGESMQILHYENGQKYEPHFDFFHDQVNQQLGGHRIATVLMYLSNVKKGGETVFPMWKVIITYIPL